METAQLQTCRTCDTPKPLSQFSFRRDNQKHRTECKPCRSNHSAATRYGVTVGEVQELVEAQGNRCAICDVHADDIDHPQFIHNPLVVDHDHVTGKVRGLLCPSCNLVLGHAKDSAVTLARAIEYLSQ